MGVTFGLAPVLYSLKANLTDVLRLGVRASAHGGWLRNSLIVAEVCLCFTLLIGAGLLLKNFDRLRQVNPGFASQHLLTFKLAPYQPGKNAEAVQRYVNFCNRVVGRLETIPGVVAVGAANAFPFESATRQRELATIGVKGDTEQEDRRSRHQRCHLLLSRWAFRRRSQRADTHDKQRVVIISERTGRVLFPNRPAIGQQIRLVFLDAADPWAS